MITQEQINTIPTLIEEIVCKNIEKSRHEPLDKEMSGLLITLLLSGKIEPLPVTKQPHLFQIIVKRIEVFFQYKISDHRLILFLCLGCGTPAKAIMMLWYLQYHCFKNDIWEIDLEYFCEKIVPFGFPAPSELDRIWDLQKVNSRPDNLVDYKIAGQSIFKQ